MKIPVIPKMTPNITHITEPAEACLQAGADAISAINTIKSVTMDTGAEVAGQRTISGYSGRAVRPIALRHVLELAQMPEKPVLSGIGGIETWRDALEFIQLGCSNVQVCTAVMQYGYRIIDDLVLGMRRYLAKRGLKSLSSLVGESLPLFLKPDSLNRDTIVYPKFNHELCVGCGRWHPLRGLPSVPSGVSCWCYWSVEARGPASEIGNKHFFPCRWPTVDLFIFLFINVCFLRVRGKCHNFAPANNTKE